MFYHAALLFDYESFKNEVFPLSIQIDKKNYTTLNDRVAEIISNTSTGEFFLMKYGFGKKLEEIKPISAAEKTPYLNYDIGVRLLIIMSQYLKPSPISIGYSWRALFKLLEDSGWLKSDIEDFIYGNPTGMLVTEKADSLKRLEGIVTHSDPYWRWIRPDMSYNQGGWISTEECSKFHDRLVRTEENIKASYSILQDWQLKGLNGIDKGKELLSIAFKEHIGIYMAVFWDWEDEENEP